jgi:hypothetical protein
MVHTIVVHFELSKRIIEPCIGMVHERCTQSKPPLQAAGGPGNQLLRMAQLTTAVAAGPDGERI